MTIAQIPDSEIEAYRRSADDVVGRLETHAQRGLTQKEASARLGRDGANELTAEPVTPAWKRFLAQFRDILVILLLVAALISAGLWFVERRTALPYEALAILAIVLLNAVMGFVQQSRAEQAVLALRRMSAATATVIRDRTRSSIAAADIVSGDIILIEEGDLVSADARLIESVSLRAGSGILHSGYKWEFLPDGGMLAATGETMTKRPRRNHTPGFQGEGGTCSCEGREDTCRLGPAV